MVLSCDLILDHFNQNFTIYADVLPLSGKAHKLHPN